MKERFYKFKQWDKSFAIDNVTGNFFELDETGWDAIDLFDSMPMGKVINTLSSKHGLKAAKKTVQIFKQLSEKGLISSNKMKFKKSNVSVPKLFYMTLNLINNCNLRCQYCWNDSGQYSQEMGSVKMDKDIAFKAIDILIEGSGAKKELVVDLYGGEPFMHWQLVKDVIQYCKSREKDTKKEFHFLLATNGTLLTLEKAKYLYDNGVDVAISIDGKNVRGIYTNGNVSVPFCEKAGDKVEVILKLSDDRFCAKYLYSIVFITFYSIYTENNWKLNAEPNRDPGGLGGFRGFLSGCSFVISIYFHATA